MSEKLIQITRFDYGMSGSDDRNLSDGLFDYLENVNCGEKRGSIKQVQNTTLASDDKSIRATIQVGAYTWGLGWVGGGSTEIKIWNLTTGVGYLSSTHYSLANKVRPIFVYDYTNNCIYFDNVNFIGKFNLSDNSFVETFVTLTGGLQGGQMWQGDCWGWAGQNLKKFSTTTGSPTTMNAIPSGQTPKKLISLGNTLGIICDAGRSDTSNMYIIDGTSTTTFIDIVPIGKGYVAGGEILDGILTVVMTGLDYKTIKIKTYNSTYFSTKYNLKSKPNSVGTIFNYVASSIKKSGGYIYFNVLGTVPKSANALEYFLMRYGRDSENKNYSLSVVKNFECVPTSTTFTLNRYDSEFEIISDVDLSIIAFLDMQQANGTMKVSTSDTTYDTQTGILETGWYDGGYANKKMFKGFMCQFAPLPSGSSVVLKYMKDAETTWTTLFTEATDNEIQRELIKNLQAKQIKFRIELLGGAELTGFLTKYETQSSKLL